MRVNFFVATLLCFLSGPMSSYAINVRVIGSGGGAPEMQALAAFQMLPEKIQFCIHGSNPCVMTEEELQILRELNKTIQDFEHTLLLEFIDTDGPVYTIHRNKFKIGVRSKAFHERIDNLRGVEWMFLAYATYFLEREFNDYGLAKTMMSEIKYGQVEVAVNDFRSKLKFSWVTGLDSRLMIQELMSEGTVNDLNSQIIEALPCKGSVKLTGIDGLPSREEGGVTATLRWYCDGQAQQGTLFAIKREGTWSFQLFSVSALEISPNHKSHSVLSDRCESLLKYPRTSYQP